MRIAAASYIALFSAQSLHPNPNKNQNSVGRRVGQYTRRLADSYNESLSSCVSTRNKCNARLAA